jgi:flagellar biosynthesis chaperone FliJ
MENTERTNQGSASENLVERNKLKNAKKEGTTRGALIAGLIALVIIIVAGAILISHYNKQSNMQLAMMDSQKTSFTKQLNQRDSLVNDWLATFDQIEKDLATIKQKENALSVKSANTELSTNKKEQILNDIKFLNNLLEENKKKISSLNAQLRKSGGTIKGLEERIATLDATIKQYENDMTVLKQNLAVKDTQIGQLNTQVATLDSTVTQQTDKINDQTRELHTAFIASGTYRQLRDRGIVSKEGGFLGLGRKEMVEDNVGDSLFTKIDITETKTIPVNSRKVKLITDHPAGSYEIVPEGDNKIAYIEIKNPDEFWKRSKVAVVELIK